MPDLLLSVLHVLTHLIYSKEIITDAHNDLFRRMSTVHFIRKYKKK